MEWSGMQQLSFLPKGAVLGIMIGMLLDVSGGYWRGKRYRTRLFISDVLTCALSAVITIFGALIFGDGYLHPVLFIGVLIGAVMEHGLLGRWLAFALYKIHGRLRWGMRKLAVGMEKIVQICISVAK